MGYGQIDADIAWNTATDGIQELRECLLSDASLRDAYERENGLALESGASDLADLIGFLPDSM